MAARSSMAPGIQGVKMGTGGYRGVLVVRCWFKVPFKARLVGSSGGTQQQGLRCKDWDMLGL